MQTQTQRIEQALPTIAAVLELEWGAPPDIRSAQSPRGKYWQIRRAAADPTPVYALYLDGELEPA